MSHSGKKLENSPILVLVCNVYFVCIYGIKSCWSLKCECSVHVNDGFPKKWGGGAVVEIRK